MGTDPEDTREKGRKDTLLNQTVYLSSKYQIASISQRVIDSYLYCDSSAFNERDYIVRNKPNLHS